MAAVFVCIVQPKVIEFNVSDQKLHRAQKDEELRSELDALKLPSPDAVPAGADGAPAAQWPGQSAVGPVLCHPGGGCRLLSRSASVSVASVGSAVCVFEGALTNVGSLAEVYTPLPEDEPTPAPAALTSAELMCHMYAKVGVEMLGLLRGSFTFVLYESKTSRVLAARDGGGRGPLFQARTAKGSLLLTNSSGLLEASDCTDKLEFQPGEFKYGWSATPRLYQPADHARLSRRSLDHSTSAHHQHQHHHQGGSRNSSRRASLDHHHQESPVGSPSASSGFMDGRHNRNHHNHHNGGAVISGSPQHAPLQQQQPGPHPHRTYVVSAEEPRIVKAAPARQQQQAAAPVAASPPTAGGAWTAVAPASASRGNKDNQQGQGQENGGQGRGGSARGGGASGDQNQNQRRSSMDTHGAWRLGAGHGVSAAGSKQQQQQPANGEEQKPQQQPQQQPQPTGPKQQQQQGQKQQQHPGTPNGGRGSKGRDGRPSLEGRTPTKQQQQTAASAQSAAKAAGSPAPAPAAAAGPRVSGAGSKTLRVDAPEFVCTRSVPAAVPPVAVAAAVVSAP